MGFSQLLQIEIVVFANYRIVAKSNLAWYILTEGNLIMSLNSTKLSALNFHVYMLVNLTI